ncbi:dihydrofolate reductase [Candidatus Woesearchaeota archaeon]|nr:dihydrofolate reductase [Candidatus Woesearchaeota archaeon]
MISIIVGMTKTGVIGKDNKLPWHIPDDLQNFKLLTEGKVVIMGRKTFESLPKKFRPLPNRHNLIISRSQDQIEGAEVCTSIEQALEKGKSFQKDIFVIGGAAIFTQALPFVDTMFISYIKKEYEGDIYFPAFNKKEWKIIDKKDFPEFESVVMKKK